MDLVTSLNRKICSARHSKHIHPATETLLSVHKAVRTTHSGVTAEKLFWHFCILDLAVGNMSLAMSPYLSLARTQRQALLSVHKAVRTTHSGVTAEQLFWHFCILDLAVGNMSLAMSRYLSLARTCQSPLHVLTNFEVSSLKYIGPFWQRPTDRTMEGSTCRTQKECISRPPHI